MQKAQKTLLLTGATGFIGRTLLLDCLKNQRYRRIVVPVRNPEKLHAQLKEEGFSTLPRELEIRAWGESTLYHVDHVLHAAGVLFSRSEKAYREVNVEGTHHLLSCLAEPPRVVVLSSQSVGGPTPENLDARVESTPDQPLTAYGRSKREMETLILRNFSSINPLILRAPMVLGPRDHAILPLFKMAKSRLRLKPGMQAKTYSWIAVEDLLDAIFTALETSEETWKTPQRIFYVSSNTPLTDMDLISGAIAACGNKAGLTLRLPQVAVKILSRIVDASPPLQTRIPSLTRDRAQEIWPQRWVINAQRFQKQFAWQPSGNLQDTLNAIAQSLK